MLLYTLQLKGIEQLGAAHGVLVAPVGESGFVSLLSYFTLASIFRLLQEDVTATQIPVNNFCPSPSKVKLTWFLSFATSPRGLNISSGEKITSQSWVCFSFVKLSDNRGTGAVVRLRKTALFILSDLAGHLCKHEGWKLKLVKIFSLYRQNDLLLLVFLFPLWWLIFWDVDSHIFCVSVVDNPNCFGSFLPLNDVLN